MTNRLENPGGPDPAERISELAVAPARGGVEKFKLGKTLNAQGANAQGAANLSVKRYELNVWRLTGSAVLKHLAPPTARRAPDHEEFAEWRASLQPLRQSEPNPCP